MIRKRTAFILGAGASQPFGFPTGRELYNYILSALRPGQDYFDKLQRFGGFNGTMIAEFREALRKSGRTSVDAFLEHRSEYMTIGKSAIAVKLIAHENEGPLFGNAGEWMGYLFDHFDHPFKEGPANSNVAFITFNYDRSLEHFLFTSYKNSYGKKDDEGAAALRHIPIIHLHGSLGRLRSQEGVGAERSYHDLVDTESLNVAREGIKIIHESLDDGRDKDFERAKEILKWAQQIYCLGFGYGATNMKRLGLKELDKKASGTGYGLTDAETAYVRALTDSNVNPEGFDCLAFLRNRVNWGVPSN
jgi:hypothetical protein